MTFSAGRAGPAWSLALFAIAAALLFALVLAQPPAAHAAGPTYSFHTIGTIEDLGGFPVGVSDDGTVATPHGVWSQGTFTPRPTAGPSDYLVSISPSGLVLGVSVNSLCGATTVCSYTWNPKTGTVTPYPVDPCSGLYAHMLDSADEAGGAIRYLTPQQHAGCTGGTQVGGYIPAPGGTPVAFPQLFDALSITPNFALGFSAGGGTTTALLNRTTNAVTTFAGYALSQVFTRELAADGAFVALSNTLLPTYVSPAGVATTLQGANTSVHAINDSHAMVGDDSQGGVMWPTPTSAPVELNSLPTVPFGDPISTANYIGNRGDITGTSESSPGSSNDSVYVLSVGTSLTASIELQNADGSAFTGGAQAKAGDTLKTKVTLTNASLTQPVTGLTVSPPLSVTPSNALTPVDGPTPAVPSSLAAGTSASYVMTYKIASKGTATLSLTANGTQNSLAVSADASKVAHLGQVLALSMSFTQQNGAAIDNNTIKLADDDDGEVPQAIVGKLTIKNVSSLQQDHLSLNGPLTPSFHSSSQALPTLPISVVPQPDPPKLPAALAPGESTTLTYAVHVGANGVFDLSSMVLSSDVGGGTNVSTGVGTLTALPTALLLLKLHPVSDIRAPITAGQPVLLSGTLRNLSNTQPLELLPIEPAPISGGPGNAGNGAVTDASQSTLPDGTRPPLAGKIKPSDVVEVEATVDTAPVPGTRATVTYEPSGFVVNDDGTETKLTAEQVRVAEGTSPVQLSFDTRDLAFSPTARSIAGNFAQGSFIAMSEWYLNGLHAAYEVASHPTIAAFKAGQGIGKFAVTSATALKQSIGLVNSIYLLNEGLKGMSPAEKVQFVNELVQDAHDYLPGIAISSLQAAAAPVLEKFANAVALGDYDKVAAMSGYGLTTGAGVVADQVLTDFAFQKLALLAKAPAGATVAESRLANEITVAQGIKEAKVTQKAGAALIDQHGKNIGAGVNLLLNKHWLLTDVYGLTTRQIKLLRGFCESNGITIALRSRSKRAAELIKRGIAVAKNLVIKLKGVNEIDVHFLGYAQTDLNTVVWAEPISHAQIERNIARYKGGVTKEIRELIYKRHAQRVKEWKNIDYRQKISTWDVANQIKLEFGGADSGVGQLDKARVRYRRFELADNPAIVHDKRGNSRYYKRFRVAKSGAKGADLVAVTQDVDLVAVLAGNLTILPAALRAKAYEYLEDILGIEHADTAPWVMNGEALFKAKTDLLVDHLEGGEALAVFGPDAGVRTAFLEPNLSVFDKVTKGGFLALVGAYNDVRAPIAKGALGKLLKP